MSADSWNRSTCAWRAAGGHGAVEVAVGDPLGVELLAQEGKERGELREDEDPVPVVERLREDLPERLELRGAVEGRRRRTFRRQASGRSRSGAGAGAGSAPRTARRASPAPGGLQVEQLALGLLLERAVERRLGGLEGAPDDLLDPRGQLRAPRRASCGAGCRGPSSPAGARRASARSSRRAPWGTRSRYPGSTNSKSERRSSREFSTGVPVRRNLPLGPERAQRLRVLGAGVLHVLRLVADDAGEFDRREELAVARQGPVGGDDEVPARELRRRRPGAFRRGGRTRAGRGAKRAASRRQFSTSEAGQTTRLVPPPACTAQRSARAWSVLPRPISSASTPAEPVAVQVPEPGRAQALVGPQDRVE